MVVYRLLGSGVTDANGVASVNYTGAGAGEMDLVASTSNPITQSSLVSETYSILDNILYDTGIDGTAQNCYALSGGVTRTPTPTGTLFSVTDGSSPVIRFYKGQNAWIPYNTNWILEFDVVEMDSSLILYGSEGLSGIGSIIINQSFALGNTVRLKYDGSKLQLFYINEQGQETPSTSKAITMASNGGLYLIKSWSTASFNLKIKNLKTYPI